VVVVRRVTVPVVHVVDVALVRYGDVPATGRVLVLVLAVRDVLRLLALVCVIFVGTVQVAIVREIDVVTVRDGDVPATVAVDVRVLCMRVMLAGNGHCFVPSDSVN